MCWKRMGLKISDLGGLSMKEYDNGLKMSSKKVRTEGKRYSQKLGNRPSDNSIVMFCMKY
jgi:hypothetical protein